MKLLSLLLSVFAADAIFGSSSTGPPAIDLKIMPSKKWKFETRELNRLREELRHEIRRQFAELEENIMDQLRVMLANPNTWATAGAPVFIPNGKAIDAISQYSQGLVPSAISQNHNTDFPAFRQESVDSRVGIQQHETLVSKPAAPAVDSEVRISAPDSIKRGLVSMSDEERRAFEDAWLEMFDDSVQHTQEEQAKEEKTSHIAGPKKLRGDNERV